MKVSVLAPQGEAEHPDTSRLSCLTRCFAEHDVQVKLHRSGETQGLSKQSSLGSQVAEPPPLAVKEQQDYVSSDVCIYMLPGSESWLPRIPSVEHGIVILDFDGTPSEGASRWLHHADLCFVSSGDIRRKLIRDYGFSTDRVYLISSDDPSCSHKVFAITERAIEGNLDAAQESCESEQRPWTQAPHLHALRVTGRIAEARANVALRDYVVRSRLPILGPIIAWVRRQLTSHLREPYLDRIIERQVAFNREVTVWMEQSSAFLNELEERLTRLEGQLDRGDESEASRVTQVEHGGEESS